MYENSAKLGNKYFQLGYAIQRFIITETMV